MLHRTTESVALKNTEAISKSHLISDSRSLCFCAVHRCFHCDSEMEMQKVKIRSILDALPSRMLLIWTLMESVQSVLHTRRVILGLFTAFCCFLFFLMRILNLSFNLKVSWVTDETLYVPKRSHMQARLYSASCFLTYLFHINIKRNPEVSGDKTCVGNKLKWL